MFLEERKIHWIKPGEEGSDFLLIQDREEVIIFLDEGATLNCFCRGVKNVLILLEKRAKLNFFALNQAGVKAMISDGAEGVFNLVNFAAERVCLEVNLLGENCKSDINGLMISAADAVASMTARNFFLAQKNKGTINITTAALDRANQNIEGLIYIGPKGGQTDSYLKMETLAIGEKVRIRALPYLEIKTNDVKAGHGAAITKIKEDDLFYLRARGISLAEAKNLLIGGLVEGFLSRTEANAKIATEIRTEFSRL